MEQQVKNILIAGGSGLIGQRITDLLKSKSFNVFQLSRNPDPKSGTSFYWDPEKKLIDKKAIESADVIINLAGAGIAEKRWTARRKRLLVNSRIFSTNLLYETIAGTQNNVKLVINASAIGIYGNTGEMIMNEESSLASDFLGKTCQRWELAAKQFESLNIRTVILRIGLVLSDEGGMLKEVMKPLRFGIAPVFGTGRQYQSWIHIDDLCKMISKAIKDEKLSGVYNAVAPQPISNYNFMKLLRQLSGKGHFLIKVPAIIMRLLLGEMVAVVIEGTRVSSKKIESTGFTFTYPQANQALRNLLGK